jgi:uncharacterized protein YggU (UPF0235/DUF167 family)
MFIRVKVKTNARRQSVLYIGENRYEISVREKPELNAANDRVRAIFSLMLQVPGKSIRFVSGHRSPSKLLEIK